MAKLTVTTIVKTTLEKSWEALWNPAHIIHWAFADEKTWHCPWANWAYPKVWELFTTRMEAKDWSFGFDLSGKYLSVDPLRSMSYSLGWIKDDFIDSWRVVEIKLEELSEGIKITETFDAEEINSEERQIEGWQMILENYKKYVESLN